MWHIELDLRPSGRWVKVVRANDADGSGNKELEEGDVIAEGTTSAKDYGSTPLDRLRFIVSRIRTYIRQEACGVHGLGAERLSLRLGLDVGWCAGVVSDAGEQLGVDRWHYSATTLHGPDRLMPGGAALGLFADQPVAAAVVLMSHHEKPSPYIDLRFVSVRHDGTLDSTGNTPPLIPMADMGQTTISVRVP